MNRGRKRGEDPVLITEARPSLLEEHDSRKRRYIVTMALRAVCLVLATVFYQTLWIMGIFAVLAIVLPWVAVMLANDRPPKRKLDAHRFRAGHNEAAVAAPSPTPAIGPVRIIDAD